MLISQGAWQTQPWKNGLGITHEIWRYRSADSATPTDGYDLRLSVAHIDGAQPFSIFAGYQRALVPLRDTTLAMLVTGQQLPMVTHELLTFSGDAQAATVGQGSAYDLNIIGRSYHAEIATSEAQRCTPTQWASCKARPLAIFALTPCNVHGTVAGVAVDVWLQRYDTWVVAPGADLAADAPVVWIRF